ncbi:MAG: Protein-L-isoaspartate O-methyltransferase [uncultured Sphingosinicella sp.]|uniref:Protein-L-isoaspartate O-methyltransferase n=1 Tax=uncultured Sphingosinicella sp. TaxID=478748 RepID=A0A6J4TPT5_9SPHN|nr:protein-L-isoaspartate O-methyltransferase [uncultured Sphingosinicella sp.]CAA9527763.1 MAG: Protein-L-isoaspartate O-methyltransferase [uncultured Sphingosinicella sp.]
MTEQNFEQMRRAMVASSLRTTGVNDPRVLAAIGAVPRERYVPRARAAMAYADNPVPLGNGRELNSPLALGRMLSEAQPAPHERTLVIAAASGYAAAVMERLAGSVVALEEESDLAAVARDNLAGSSVELVEGPLVQGHAPGAPYDFILIDGAVEFIPEEIIGQLVDGGRLAAAILDNGVARISLGRRAGEGFGIAPITDRASAILPSFVRPRAFTF